MAARALAATILLLVAPAAPPSPEPPAPPPAADAIPAGIVPARAPAPALAEASAAERDTLARLLAAPSWPRRALASLRLERYSCPDSEAMVRGLLSDRSWQVRAFAVRAAGRRRLAIEPGAFDAEQEPYVLRAALRHRYQVDPERLERGVRTLAGSRRHAQMVLAAELGAASGDDDLLAVAEDLARTVILRMSRAEAGALGPRLALLTGQRDMRRPARWQKWLQERGNRYGLDPSDAMIPAGAEPLPTLRLAELDAGEFAALESYIQDLGSRRLDLAIAIDCTASMFAELADAQGGIDDLMMFVGDVVDSVRIAIVAYRDRRDEFEVKWWDFTTDVEEARVRLWSLTATGGGDRPEAVYPALRQAILGLAWDPESTRILVLVGDAPPHVGYGALTVELAGRAAEEGKLTTHVIQADTRPVKHFHEIAAAGKGRLVTLDRRETGSLVVEIAGLTLGERYDAEMREFFQAYLDLCR